MGRFYITGNYHLELRKDDGPQSILYEIDTFAESDDAVRILGYLIKKGYLSQKSPTYGVILVVSDIQAQKTVYQDEPEAEKMNLRAALKVACAGGSVTPGALYRESYVCYDEESDGTSGQPWQYVPDIHSKKPEWYHLTDEQLERVVLFADALGWQPTSNLVIE